MIQISDFKKLSIDDLDIIEQFTAHYLPYSDFSFLSLFTYNTKETLEYCFIDNNLVIKFEDYTSDAQFFSILGSTNIEKNIGELMDLSSQLGLEPSLGLIPETTIDAAPGLSQGYIITEDRDNFDYIVVSKDIAELSVEEFPKKRHLIDKFMTQYPHCEGATIDLTSSSSRKAILDTFSAWKTINNKSEHEVTTEYVAVKRLLDNHHHFPQLHAVGIYDGYRLVAFNTFEVANDGYGISSFQKADKNYDGIYAYLTHVMAKKMVKLNCEFINFEQDLGIEGLRSSKLSWHPVNFLKKYTVTPK
jgi:hypothetical protein